MRGPLAFAWPAECSRFGAVAERLVAGDRTLARTRIPLHAFSEADRLLARALEAIASPLVVASRQCWRSWQRPQITTHDGTTGAHSDVALGRALRRAQSTTSLRRLLRDPAGFVWRYALGWRSPTFEQQPLVLSPSVFGELVHELMRRAIDALEADPGVSRASETKTRNAVEDSRSGRLTPRGANCAGCGGGH